VLTVNIRKPISSRVSHYGSFIPEFIHLTYCNGHFVVYVVSLYYFLQLINIQLM